MGRVITTLESVKRLIDKEIKTLQNELTDLQVKFQPKRFEQVIDLIIGKCQEMIDTNEIFVEGDKDIFLKIFVEPSLKSNNSKPTQEAISSKPNSSSAFKPNPTPINGQVEIFHYFSRTKQKATATFDPSSKKIIYNGEHNLSPSGAAMKATKDNNGNNPNLNGWIFWKYIDRNGNEKTIDTLK